MKWNRTIALACVASALMAPTTHARAAAADDGDASTTTVAPRVEMLVPEMAHRGFHLQEGERPYQRRLGFSPAFGRLGGDPYYAMRMSFNPQRWLGWEAQIGHNPAESVHALVHALSVQLRWPLPWRLQPYGTLGYGMMLIFPGRVFEADPVTKNLVGIGVGTEFFLRDDVALRGELRGVSVFGTDPNGGGTSYGYREFTFGMTFYRTIAP